MLKEQRNRKKVEVRLAFNSSLSGDYTNKAN